MWVLGLSKLMWHTRFVSGVMSVSIFMCSLHPLGWMNENLGSYSGCPHYNWWPKWILITNPTMIKKFQSPSLRWPKIFRHHFFNVSLWPCQLHDRITQGKRRIMEIPIWSPCKNIIFRKKKSFKRDQTPSRYHNYITNPTFQHKPKYHLSKIFA